MKQAHHTPDTLLLNGCILTLDENSSIHQAMAIRCSHIQAVGRDVELKPLAGSNTRIIDLHGLTAIPGIVDAHAHMDREGLKNLLPTLSRASSISDILAVIKAEVARKKKGEWVVIMPPGDPPNYAGVPENLVEKRYPTRWEMDTVSPDHPVYIKGIWPPWNIPPSVSVANSRALQLAGIDRHTPSPHSSVVIEKDAAGEPTGVIIDRNMYPITEFTLMRVVPRFTQEDRTKALRDSMRTYNSVGVTSVYEGHGLAPEVLLAYKTLWDEGAMTVRSHLVISPTWASLKEAEKEMAERGCCLWNDWFGDDLLRFCGYFLQLRGQRHVARFRSEELPYTGWAGFAVSYNAWPRFLALTLLAARHRIRVHTIASTEEEMEEVLGAYEAAQKEFPMSDRRWVIEHVRDVQASQLERIKSLGVVCQTIPLTHLWLRGASYLEDAERADRAIPHQDFLQRRIPFALGTDNKPYNPFHTLWAAIARREKNSGAVIGSRQCLSPAQGLMAFTMGGAYLCGQETRLGSLEAGKLADLAVLSDDPLQIFEERLQEIRVHLTMVGGRVVHDDGVCVTDTL
ncbi:MAG: amidohydrolase [Thermodesulfobacteriota bacterium]|nr:amidohydrolase [Thermodesulfobacteriota bacterium]